MESEILFDDLIEEYEKTHGTLWTYSGGDNITSGSDTTKNKWISSDSEKQLYHEIALRIEAHMEILTKKVVCGEN